MKIRWSMRVSNEEVRATTNTSETMSQVIKEKEVEAHRSHTEIRGLSHQNCPDLDTSRQEKQREAEGDMEEDGGEGEDADGFTSWGSAGAVARDRKAWRSCIGGPIVHPDRRT